MQNIDKVVELYLKMDTNYALMITGEWGSGKTYYYKNILASMISRTPILHKQGEKYNPILVSLFGLKSIEEVQTEIVMNMYPILKNKYVRLGTGLGKSLIKGVLKLKGLGEIDKAFSETPINTNEWINYEDLVICFDDLERMSKSLKIEELIGFINSLVENENVKVLIIANEGKINDPDYFFLKEKTVGNSIEFQPDFEISFMSLIKHFFEHKVGYRIYLENNKNFIAEVFKPHSINFRILTFALSYFEIIYEELEIALKTEILLNERKHDILLNTLKFAICISIEYKKGNISHKDRKDLDRVLKLTLTQLMAEKIFTENKNNVKDNTFLKQFSDTYYNNDHYIFYPSIYNYITGGEVFQVGQLINNLKSIYHIVKDEIPEHYKIYNKLDFRNCFSLTNEEYIKQTKALLRHSDQGKYKLEEYPTIFYFASRFGNPINYNLLKLEMRIIKGMRRGKSNYYFISNLDMHFGFGVGTENIQNISSIINACLKINQEVKDEQDHNQINNLESLCYTDFDSFLVLLNDKSKEFMYKAVFNNFSFLRFYTFVLKSDNQRIVNLVRMFYDRSNQFSPEYKAEKIFLDKLQQRLDAKSAKMNGKNVRGFAFQDLCNNLRKYRERIGN